MANPDTYRPKPGEIPTDPGVYRFRDENGRIIYVGKAKNLRSRLNSYFANPATLMPKTYAMVHHAASVQWTIVGSELEALQLEYTWIKEFAPRYNLVFKDDKSYPYLAVSMGEKFPRVQVMRGERRKGTKYFGPYTAGAIRETTDTLLRVFPVRSCSPGVLRRAERSGRPCLLGYIDKCAAPCVGRISVAEHKALAQDFCDFMGGEAKRFISSLEKKMAAAVAELDYEQAARLRDDIVALRKVFERNAVVLAEDTNADIFAVEQDELEAAVQVFHVRGGRIRGQRGWVVEKVEDATAAELWEHLMQQVYGGQETQPGAIPRQILVPELPANHEELAVWLGGLRQGKVSIKVPQRGDKAALMHTVQANARQSMILHKSRRAGDLTTRSLALQELQEALELPMPLLRIECFDISHVQGTNVVASMVVVEDGLAKKSEYRKFAITGDAAIDDTASMHNVITRRFKNYLAEKAERAQLVAVSGEIGATPPRRSPVAASIPGGSGVLPEDPLVSEGKLEALVGEPGTLAKSKFVYPPNLVVVDGGIPQVNAAARALAELGITDVAVVGLAKRLEEVWVPGSDFPVILPRASQGLYLLQRIRDEAHRFAITFHRAKRGKSMTASILDTVPGLGAAKQKNLMAHFGTLKKVRSATVTELLEAPGVGPVLAQSIFDTVNPAGAAADTVVAAAPSVNMTTGEILD